MAWNQFATDNFLFVHGTWIQFNPFPHNDTFWWVWERSLLKTLWEKEKLLVQAISPFHTMFSTLSNLSSANAFNFVWSNILSFGNGLNQGYYTQIYLQKLWQGTIACYGTWFSKSICLEKEKSAGKWWFVNRK